MSGAWGDVTGVDDGVEGIDDGGNWEIYEPIRDELQYGKIRNRNFFFYFKKSIVKKLRGGGPGAVECINKPF